MGWISSTVGPVARRIVANRRWERRMRCRAALVIVLAGIGALAPVATAEAGWSIVPSPALPGDSYLQGLSCSSATACTAVGYDNSSAGQLPVVERWNGTSWSLQYAPWPQGAVSLNGVSCPSPSSCVAVGSSFDSSTGIQRTLAEHWNGTTWTIQSTPNQSGAQVTVLSGVSCTSATACTAVGYYEPVVNGGRGGRPLAFAERWNGSTWTIQATALSPIPDNTNPTSTFYGVSCTSATSCTAVGTAAGAAGGQSLAEHWNGTAWTVQPTVDPPGASTTGLRGVSCPNDRTCIGAGFWVDSASAYHTLVEVDNGVGWVRQSSPDPAVGGIGILELTGVSCTSASTCIAVGDYYNTLGDKVTLAEAWNGSSWAIQPTPNPAGSTGSGSVLSGVLCTSPVSCDAVGNAFTGAGWNGLIEHYSG